MDKRALAVLLIAIVAVGATYLFGADNQALIALESYCVTCAHGARIFVGQVCNLSGVRTGYKPVLRRLRHRRVR